MPKTLVLKVAAITAAFTAGLMMIGLSFPSAAQSSNAPQALPEMVSLQMDNPAGAAPQAIANWEIIDGASAGIDLAWLAPAPDKALEAEQMQEANEAAQEATLLAVKAAREIANWEIIDGASAGYVSSNG